MIWIPIGIAILGVVPLLILWFKRRANRKHIATALLTTGKLLILEERRGYKGYPYFMATIEYRAGNEVFRGYKRLNYSCRKKIIAGQSIEVLYDPVKPTKFQLKDFPYDVKVMMIVVIVFALGYFALAYFVYKEFRL